MIPISRTVVTHLLALLVTVLFACSPEQPDVSTEIFLETEDDKTIYAMGVTLSGNVQHVPMTKSEKGTLLAGFTDGLHKRDPKVDTLGYGRRADELFRRRNADRLREDSKEQRDPGSTEILLETEDDKTIYAMGANLSGKVRHVPMSKPEKEILLAGFDDGIYGRAPKIDVRRYGRRVEDLFRRRNADRIREDPEEAEAFLAEAAAVEGAQRSDSGIVMVLLRRGDGPSPGPTDRVKVHYHGTLRDGTVFDSTLIRGEPMVLTLNRTIPCWTAALPRMKTGERSRITCPADIAYGDQGSPPLIKPGAVLAFEVELLEVLE
jgi:FKBP-type peptidyl-prolyl cis-trans isomerase